MESQFQCTLFVWLMAPGALNGSVFIYTRFIRSQFLKHQNSVDEAIDKIVHAGKICFVTH